MPLHPTTVFAPGVNLGVLVDAGRYTKFNFNCLVQNCSVGSFCSIGAGTIICPTNHQTNWVTTHGLPFCKGEYPGEEYQAYQPHLPEPECYTQRVNIHHDVWTGQNSIILPRVTVGTGAIIGAGAVVTKNVLPYAIVGGNPAKLIRYRFSDAIISGLLISQWWEQPLSVLEGLPWDNPEAFLQQFAARRVQTG